MSQFVDTWSLPQARLEIKPYALMYELDAREQETLASWLSGPQVDIEYDLNDDTDYAVQYLKDNRVTVARISDCVTINGVRWHLQPGKNRIPKAVYEFLVACPSQRERVSCPQAGQPQNLGLFR